MKRSSFIYKPKQDNLPLAINVPYPEGLEAKEGDGKPIFLCDPQEVEKMLSRKVNNEVEKK